MGNEINIKGAGRDQSLPTPVTQGEMVVVRSTRYGEPVVMPFDINTAAEEGTLFIARNATNDASTTLAGHAAPVLADADATLVKPFFFMRVPNGVTKRVYLKSIEIEVVTAGATGTQACWAAQLDTGTTRYSSGGTALSIFNPNMQSSATSVFASQTNHLLGGDVVVGAEGANCRPIGFGTIRPSIEIAGDIKVFVFGGDPAAMGTQTGQAAAAIRTSVVNLPPVVLGATDQFLLALHSQASQNAAGVYKVRATWVER